MKDVLEKLKSKRTASSPNCVPARVWALFKKYFERGVYSGQWKAARLVQIRKDGRSADQPSVYRPICLLDEIGKIFEKILVSRLVRHLNWAVAPGCRRTSTVSGRDNPHSMRLGVCGPL